MLKLTEGILDKLQELRDEGKTKREAVKILTGVSLTTFNAAAEREGLVSAIRKIYPPHGIAPDTSKNAIRIFGSAEEALTSLKLDRESLHARAATMRWNVSPTSRS